MDNDIAYEILDYLQTELEIQLRKDIVPKFWKWFKGRVDNTHNNQSINIQLSNASRDFHTNQDTFVCAVKELYNTVTKCLVYAQRLDQLAIYFQKVTC